MMYRRFTICLCSLGVFLLCLSGVSKANPSIADSLVTQGEKFITEKNFSEAAHELARALLIQIDHKEARARLLNLRTASGLDLKIKSQIKQYGESYAILQSQQHDINQLLSKRAELTEALLNKGVPGDKIQERLYYWEGLAYKNKNRTDQKVREELSFERDPLKLLNGFMRLEKEKKFNKLSYLEQQYDDLANLRLALASEGIEEAPNTMDIVHTERFYNSHGEAKYKSGTRPILRFKNFQDMKEYMVYQGERIEKLSDQVVDLSLRISEKDMQISDKREDVPPKIEYVDAESKEWESRFELSERIIKRKDEQILNLEESISNYKDLLQEKELYYAQKLANKESSIEALGEELFALNVKVERLKNERLAMTKKELRKIAGKRVEKMEGQLALKDSKVDELEGVLKLYKGLLADTSKTSKQKDFLIEEKDVMISSLHQDVNRLQSTIARKDSSLDGHRTNLESLQVQVNLMQDELIALESSGETNPFVTPVLEKRVIEMKAQLNDLNHFIQKELQRNIWPNLN